MNKVVKIILYVILFSAFGASLFVSYLYVNKHRPRPIPEELKEQMPEIIYYNVNILGIDGDTIKVQNMENQEELEMMLASDTVYSKTAFGSDQSQTAIKSDITADLQANITVLKIKDSPELKVQFIELLMPY